MKPEQPITKGVNLAAIPSELQELPQWGLWRYANGTKMPFDIYGEPAKSNDPSTWSDFETVTERYAIADSFDGIAFFFSPDDPYCGIDLDGCRNPETDDVQPWAEYWIDTFATYTEISPSTTGFKLICKGKNTRGTGGNKKVDEAKVSDKTPGVEIYDKLRFWTFTGWHVPTTPATIELAQPAIDELLAKYWAEPKSTATATNGNSRLEMLERCWRYIQKMRNAISGQDGSGATYAAACRCFEFGLTDSEASEVIRRFNASKTGGEQWNDKELDHKLSDARKKVTAAGKFASMIQEQPHRNNGQTQSEATQPAPLSIRAIGELIDEHPQLRAPVIHGLLRQGETVNVISSPKVGKSWLVADLALSIVTGRKWLDLYDVETGKVLIIDNELHGETIAYRIGKVADELGLVPSDYHNSLHVVTLRGRLTDIVGLGPSLLDDIEPSKYLLIVLDALYRAVPIPRKLLHVR